MLSKTEKYYQTLHDNYSKLINIKYEQFLDHLLIFQKLNI